MKKLVVLLCAVILVGGAGCYLLANHSDKQVQLPKSFEEAKSEEAEETEKLKAPVEFSKNGSFYDTDISVELTAEEGASIYYTTDGNDPTENSKQYSEPIEIKARSKVTATTIKAIAVKDGEISEIVHKSYITGKNVFDRFDESTLVFVLSTDEYNLYDYYNGVATEGAVRDEYLNSDDYDGGEVSYDAPANWSIGGRESERDMYVEAFTSDGEQIISQAAGGRVVGGASRAVSQKSWRLIARNIYSEGKFKYPFFEGNADSFGNLINRYDRITLRNNANDREFASIRDELSMTLASETGFPDVQRARPAAVFLNSEYYGFSWLHEAYSNDYLEMEYGGIKENFRIVGSKEKEVEGDDEQSVNDWNHLLELAESGLTDEKNFSEFCELVDLDNFLKYYAIQIYIDNKDWPGNNYKAWRYYPSEGEVTESPYLDGKWRLLLFDAEFAWGLYGNGYKDNTLNNVLTGNHMQGESLLLRKLLEREDMQQAFAAEICDLIGGSFAAEHVLETIEKLIEECDTECMYALNNGYTSTWANENTFADSRQQIRDFAEKRPTVMLRSLSNQFGYEQEYYNVKLYNPVGAETCLNSQILTSSGTASASYFKAVSVTAQTKPYAGYEFDRWEVNGEVYTDEKLEISASMADEEGNITVTLYLKKTAVDAAPVISELYTAGEGDWIEIYNPSDDAVSISGYFLSDDEDDLKKWEFPACSVPAKSVLTVVCKNNKETSALHKYQTNFNLKTGETLYFSDKDGNIISSARVVVMDEDKSITLGIDGKYRIGSVTEGYHIEE
ncbi:MAG: CotH kinase family protein [Ruminiclostridium sp.]